MLFPLILIYAIVNNLKGSHTSEHHFALLLLCYKSCRRLHKFVVTRTTAGRNLILWNTPKAVPEHQDKTTQRLMHLGIARTYQALPI
jgi:hypothetical protein